MKFFFEGDLSAEERITCLDRMRKHHVARVPDLPLVLLSLTEGLALLWRAVGEGVVRDMIAKNPLAG